MTLLARTPAATGPTPRRKAEKFGYFVFSENQCRSNWRSASQFIENVVDEALYTGPMGREVSD
jgi:hypothetical protein